MPHYVYKYVLDKEIIYIGKADRKLDDRLREHGKKGDNIPEEYWDEINRADIYYAECNSAIMSDTLETALIDRYKPKCNKSKKTKISGYSLIEPLWYYYHGKVDKQFVLSAKEAKKKLADVERQIKVRESIIQKKEHEFYDTQLNYCEECHYRQDMTRLMNHDAIIGKREYLHSTWLTNKQCDENIKTIEEIIQLYKNNATIIDYTSTCYDSIGNVECIKSIFTDQFGNLAFSFHCMGNEDKQGTILHSPTDDTIHNYQVLKQWESKGSKHYYPNNIIKDLVNWESKGGVKRV